MCCCDFSVDYRTLSVSALQKLSKRTNIIFRETIGKGFIRLDNVMKGLGEFLAVFFINLVGMINQCKSFVTKPIYLFLPGKH
jgi:hypothetical protein